MSNSTPLDQELLKQFSPLNRLSENQLILLASRASIKKFRKRQVVFELGSRDHHDYFLLEGMVSLEAADGRVKELAAGTTSAHSAVAHLQPRQFGVRAVTDAAFLIVEQDVLGKLIKEAPTEQYELETGGMEGEETYGVLMTFYQDLKSNNFVLPSMPDIAVHIRQVSNQPNCSAEDIAKVINLDPAMTVKLIKSCNSPLYRGFSEVETCKDAVIRLGFETTRQLITVFSMRELFRSKSALLQRRMTELWEHSREVAAISYVLATMTPGLNPEHALMAGLIHDVGAIPVIQYAEQFSEFAEDETLLDSAITELRAELGCTMLEHWGFRQDLVEAVVNAEEWRYDSPGEEPNYADLVILAQLHAFIGKAGHRKLPPMDQIPAFHKLANGELTPERSLKVISEAKHQVEEVKQFLSAA